MRALGIRAGAGWFALAAVVCVLIAPASAAAAAPPNDNFSAPLSLDPFDPKTVDNTEATEEGSSEPLTPTSNLGCPKPPDPPAQVSKTVWYRFDPTEDRRYSVNTFGSLTDTLLAVYNTDGTPTPGNGPPNASDPGTNMFGCNDNAGPFSTGSRVEFTAQAGFGYLIQVGTAGAAPVGVLRVLVGVEPPNDNRAGAESLVVGNDLFRQNMAADEESGEDLECAGNTTSPLGSTAWFRYDAPSYGRATFTVDGTLDAVTQVYRGNAAQPMACNDDSTTPGESEVSVDVAPGRYFIQVGGFRGTQENYKIASGFTPEPDSDGDGFQRTPDCDDNNPARHPGARDIPGNGVDEDCSGSDAARPARPATPGTGGPGGNGGNGNATPALLGWRYAYRIAGDGKVTKLTVKVRRGARVRVTCRGKGCPRGKSFRSKGRRLKVNRIFKRALANGAKITLRATLKDHIGRTVQITRRRGKKPKKVERCLRPGSTTPIPCP